MQIVEKFKEIASTKYGCVIIDFAIIVLIAVVIFRNLLFTSEWPAGGDVLGWISRAYLFGKDFRWLYLWHPYSFGFVEGINLLDFFFFILYMVCHDASCTTKLLMFFSFLVAGFSMYAFAYHYTRKRVAALSASLIYTLNQWFFSQFTEGHVDIIFSYSFAPLLFLLLDRALETRESKDALALTLGLSVFITGFHPECIIIYGIFLVLFAAFYVFLPMKPKNFGVRVKNLLRTLLPVVPICSLLSAFWFIPFVVNVRAYYYSSAYMYPLEDAFTWSYRNVVDAFTLRAVENLGYYLVVAVPEGLSLPDFPISFFLVSLFGLAYCTVFFRRDRYTFFLLVSALISIFMSMGPYSPFGYTFIWAWFNIPHFAVFRAADRWVMMAALSHAFFVSILVSVLANYVKKKQQLRAGELHARTKIWESTRIKQVYLSFGILNRLTKKTRKFLYYCCVLLLIIILLSGFLSCWFFFSQGLQVYTPPQSYLESYEWIAERPGDYKIVTVGEGSDFGNKGMITEVGWGHDVGWESSFIHDRPTLQDGGWEPLSRAFVSYLRFQLVPQSMTADLLEILGTLNYKYVVLPPYTSASVRDFFLNQQGGHVVYNQSSIIVENEFYTPRIFAPAQHVVIVGGLESFNCLSKINTFDLDETALVFAHQLCETPLSAHTIFNSSKALVFVNSDILDLVMLSLKDDACFINAAEYGIPSLNSTKYWIRSLPWTSLGGFLFCGNTITTSGKNSVNIPFKVDSEGVHDIWIRSEFAPVRGKLSISIDGIPSGEVMPSSFWPKFMWVNITHLDMRRGDHVITLSNDGTGYNYIDTIAVVKPSVVQSKIDEVLNTLQSFSGRIIYALQAESAFSYDLSGGWSCFSNPYDDSVVHTEGIGYNISPEGNASASSTWSGFEAHLVNDESIYTRWASSIGDMPQWLQIEWATTPQELAGVSIIFERACARDYIIQTWNGTSWIDQISVTENTLLERRHIFDTPVQTTKLRVYVTSSAFDGLVSICELEAFTPASSISTKVSIPREGRYMLALRLASGPEHGTLILRTNNNESTISCFSSDSGFQWYESGPVYFNVGEHVISLTGIRKKIDFDEMIIYSLKDEENTPSLSQVFKCNSIVPSISYERENPCKYTIHVDSLEPFILAFSDAYHPLWKVYVNDLETSSFILYSFVNGFLINKTGKFDVTLYFTGQTYADIGVKVSTVTLIAVIVVMSIPSRVFQKLKNNIVLVRTRYLKKLKGGVQR